MAQVRSLTWIDFVDFVANAKERVCLIMPAIHEEWIEMFKLCIPEVRISICVEISEEVTRRGYGDTRLVRRLQKMGIEVKEAESLKLQFLSVDGNGWCIYTESHILSSDIGGVNAIELGQADTEGIIADIFGYPEGRNENQIARNVNQENLKSIEAQLELTPPVSPDIERQIRVYTNYFQIVELNLKQFGFLNKKIRLPEKELGYWGEQISKKIRSQLNLFSKETKAGLRHLRPIENMIEELKSEYLVKFPERKNKHILCRSEKEEFLAKLKTIQSEIDATKKGLASELEEMLVGIKDDIFSTVSKSLRGNRQLLNEAKAEMFPNDYIEDKIEMILRRIEFPMPIDLIDKMELSLHFYDLTYEDISNTLTVNWFRREGLFSKCNCSEIAKQEIAFKEAP